MVFRWLFAIALLASSFAVAFWGGLAARQWKQVTQAQEEKLVGGLAVSAADLDMAEVWEEKGVVWRLPIRNRTTTSIDIREFKTSCGCTAIKPRSLSIPAGETATVQLTIDLTHRSLSEYGMERRPFAVSIQPIAPGIRCGGGSWQLHGIVRSRVTLDRQNVHFGDQPIHGQPAAALQARATVHVPCQRLEVVVNPLVAAATVKQRGDETQFDITIAANPDFPPGSFQTNAEIYAVAPSGKRALAATLPIAGDMQPEVRLLPSRVLLGPTSVGEMSEAVITLQNPSVAGVEVDHIEIDDPELHIEPARIEGISSERTYRLRQRAAKEGEQTSTVRFIIRKPGHKIVTLPVEVSYRGEAAKKTSAKRTEGGRQP